jgi:tRNA dimethylallyltransferase
MSEDSPNTLVVLGPTASGKTTLGVALARWLGGEIVSADSRQVYRELNIGSGKDLHEYEEGGASVPYHLIDVVGLDSEFNVFEYQRRFFEVFENLRGRDILPVVVGGTGLYLESVLKGYRMVDAPEDAVLRAELAEESPEALIERLRDLKPALHNTTDTEDRGRIIRAIEIAVYAQNHEPTPTPALRPIILGVRWPRPELHDRIGRRLKARLDTGLVEEVEALLKAGVSPERLRLLGLEYRFLTEFLEGRIKNRNDLYQKLRAAIVAFAKRQETWFRRMERKGSAITWVERGDLDAARAAVEGALRTV